MFGNNMANTMMDRMFRKVDGLCWDMMSGKMAVMTKDGLMTAVIDEQDPDNSHVDLNLMSDFGMPIPAFAQGTKVEDIKVGDIIINGNRVQGWVVKAEDNKFRLLTTSGGIHRWNPPHVTMMGFESGTLVVRSLLNMVGGNGVQSMQNMMMPLMMSGMIGGDGDGGMMESMMPMMLMNMTSGAQSGDAAAGGMMGMQSMMQTMMMAKMFKSMGGGNNTSPMNNLRGVSVSIGDDDGSAVSVNNPSGSRNFFRAHN